MNPAAADIWPFIKGNWPEVKTKFPDFFAATYAAIGGDNSGNSNPNELILSSYLPIIPPSGHASHKYSTNLSQRLELRNYSKTQY